MSQAALTIGCKVVLEQRQIRLQVSCPCIRPKLAHHQACTIRYNSSGTLSIPRLRLHHHTVWNEPCQDSTAQGMH